MKCTKQLVIIFFEQSKMGYKQLIIWDGWSKL